MSCSVHYRKQIHIYKHLFENYYQFSTFLNKDLVTLIARLWNPSKELIRVLRMFVIFLGLFFFFLTPK